MTKSTLPPVPPEPFSLRRWSRRKLDASHPVAEVPGNGLAQKPPAVEPASAEGVPAVSLPSAESRVPAPEPALPPVESLSIESDFSVFMQPRVDESLRRAALKQLFRDPRFNVMDGLDVYIDDYSKFEPMPPEWVRQLAHARHLFDPPKMVVNDEGYAVEATEVAKGEPPVGLAAGLARDADPEAPEASAAGAAADTSRAAPIGPHDPGSPQSHERDPSASGRS